MNKVKIIFLPTEPTERKGMFDMNYSSVDGYLLAGDLEKQMNDLSEVGYLFLRMESVNATRTTTGVAAVTTIGYLLFFEKMNEAE